MQTDMAGQETARETDNNDYLLIRDNPITRAGVFQYKGSSLPGGDPDKIYNVYRPLEELESPETLASFVGLPIVDEHEMLGGKYPRSPEERGVHGSILETVRVAGNDVLANLRIWSRTLKGLIDSGKKGLSLGYKCLFEKSAGVFEGIRYDYIQRNIRGNHLALVNQGRSGTAVLDESDVLDHFDLAFDTGELNMADKEDDKKDDKKPENAKDGDDKGGDKDEMSLADVTRILGEIVPMISKINEHMSTMTKMGDPDEALDGDTKEKEGDQKAEDKDCDKKDAMDADDVTRIVDGRMKNATKTLLSEVTKRDALAKDLIPLIGSFDHTAMDADDVAAYGVKKLGLDAPKGTERAALSGYLAGVKKAGADKTGFAMDSAIAKPKADGLLSKRLNSAA